MNRLTSRRVNGIKTGYWSPAKKEDLVQRLGEYEDTGMEPDDVREIIGVPVWFMPEEQLPPKGERVICLTQTKKGFFNHVIGYWDGERWVSGMNSNVIRWTWLPQAPGGI